MLKVQRVYHYVRKNRIDENGNNWCETDITTDENNARAIDKDYRLATLDQVEEFISMGHEPIQLIEVEDGIYYWVEMVTYLTVLGDEEVFQGYIWIQNNSEWEIRDMAAMISRIRIENKKNQV